MGKFFLIAIIALVLFVIIGRKVAKANEEKNKPILPPTEDIKFGMGCVAAGCGYYVPIFLRDSDGEYRRTDERHFHCKYAGRDLPNGCKCPFAVDHPDRLRKSEWDF